MSSSLASCSLLSWRKQQERQEKGMKRRYLVTGLFIELNNQLSCNSAINNNFVERAADKKSRCFENQPLSDNSTLKMMKSKQDKWRKMHRQLDIEKRMREGRNRQMLSNQLQELLDQYQKCSLVNNAYEQLPHNCYAHCQNFVSATHEEIMRLALQLGIDCSKHLLLHFPQILAHVMDAVELKPLDVQSISIEEEIRSRDQVLLSTANLVSFLSYDQELVSMLGNKALNLLADEFRKCSKLKEVSYVHLNIFIGLYNLLSYPSYGEEVFKFLKESGFELFIEKIFTRINQMNDYKSQPPKEVLALFRSYLQYQHKFTNCDLNRPFQKFLGKFLPDCINIIVNEDSKWDKNIQVNYIVEEMLGILLFVNLLHVEQTDLVRNIKLFKKVEYSRLLNLYTKIFPKMTKFQYFSDYEIREILQCLKDLEGTEEFEEYLENIAFAFIHLLETTKKPEQNIERLWKMLSQSKTTDFFFNEQKQTSTLALLSKMLDMQPQQHL